MVDITPYNVDPPYEDPMLEEDDIQVGTVIIKPFDRSVEMGGKVVREKITPYPDQFNHEAVIEADISFKDDFDSFEVKKIKRRRKYVSYKLEKKFYEDNIYLFVKWFYEELEAQERAERELEEKIKRLAGEVFNSLYQPEKERIDAKFQELSDKIGSLTEKMEEAITQKMLPLLALENTVKSNSTKLKQLEPLIQSINTLSGENRTKVIELTESVLELQKKVIETVFISKEELDDLAEQCEYNQFWCYPTLADKRIIVYRNDQFVTLSDTDEDELVKDQVKY